MEPNSSLADLLGVQDPLEPERPVAPAPTKITPREFCRNIIASTQYRESILRRIVMDELPPQVEAMIWDRAYGKSVERIEVNNTYNDLQNKTAEELAEEAETLAAQMRDAIKRRQSLTLVVSNPKRDSVAS